MRRYRTRNERYSRATNSDDPQYGHRNRQYYATGAILEAIPPPPDERDWRRPWMNRQSSPAISMYTHENKDFVPYFRPLRRNKNWANCRWVHVRETFQLAASITALFLISPDAKPPDAPAWLRHCCANKMNRVELEAMCRDWPFFSTRPGMLEMVFGRTVWRNTMTTRDAHRGPQGKELHP